MNRKNDCKILKSRESKSCIEKCIFQSENIPPPNLMGPNKALVMCIETQKSIRAAVPLQ